MLAWLWRQLTNRLQSPTPPQPPPTVDDPLPESVFHDAAVRFLEVQFSVNNLLDTRNGTTFSVGSTILPVTVGLLNLGTTRIPDSAIVCLVVALGCYVLLLGCSWRASAIRGLEHRPHLPTLGTYVEDYFGRALQRWVAQEYLKSTEANRNILAVKGRWLGVASALLYVEGFFLSIAALLTLL